MMKRIFGFDFAVVAMAAYLSWNTQAATSRPDSYVAYLLLDLIYQDLSGSQARTVTPEALRATCFSWEGDTGGRDQTA